MWAFSLLASVQQLGVSVKMFLPFFSVEELLHPRGRWKRRISQAERAIPRAGEGSAVDERVALDGECFRLRQVNFAVIVPFVLANNPLTAVEAQLGKAVAGYETLFVAAIDVPPPLGGRSTTGSVSCKWLDMYTKEIVGKGITHL